jgi:hypothetical protein
VSHPQHEVQVLGYLREVTSLLAACWPTLP